LFDFFRRTAEHAADEGRPSHQTGGGHPRRVQSLRTGDVMKPRADILGSKTCGFAEVVERFVEAEHSHMPVTRGARHPVGVVHEGCLPPPGAQTQPKPEPDLWPPPWSARAVPPSSRGRCLPDAPAHPRPW
jgi:hypothetical protein